MPGKEQEIENLIRNDYPLPILQEMIAEIVIRTDKNHEAAIEKRFNAILKAMFGKPEKTVKERSENFIADLQEVAKLSQDPDSTEHYTKTIGKAAATVARERILLDFNRGDPIPKDLTIYVEQEIDTYRKALIRELESKNSIERIKLGQYRPDVLVNEEGYDFVEFEFIEALLQNWTKKYGSYWTKS